MLLVLVAGASAGGLRRARRASPGGTGAFFGMRTASYLCTLSLPALLAGSVGVMVMMVSRRSKS
jgi:hypothetical protein